MDITVESLLSPNENEIIKQIDAHMDKAEYSPCQSILNDVFNENSKRECNYYLSLLACKAIDIGSESFDLEYVKQGLSYIENHRDGLKKFIVSWSIEYNLGNAKKAIFEITRKRRGGSFSAGTFQGLIEAKNHYWKAFKLLQEREDPIAAPQLLTNLAGCLSTSGRISEALYYYDKIIEVYPQFYMAHIGRSRALLWLNDLSNTHTVKLMLEAESGYSQGLKYAKEQSLREFIKKQIEPVTSWLQKKRTSEDDDILKSQQEFLSMPSSRQLAIRDHLTLNEHALYCHCIAADRDSLTLPIKNPPIISDSVVPKMEHFLNRFKAEFALARKLYYDARNSTDDAFFQHDYEVSIVDLGLNEDASCRTELLRASFRTCIGILDKIAEAVCELFDLAAPKEKIYFESFWRNNDSRWEKLNALSNYSLLALYNQATDLNTNTGEWAHFKEWRNALEHGLFVITSDDPQIDLYEILEGRRRAATATIEDFSKTTEHLLQFVRSAIFNFVFCTRTELIRQSKKSDNEAFAKITLRPVINNKTLKKPEKK